MKMCCVLVDDEMAIFSTKKLADEYVKKLEDYDGRFGSMEIIEIDERVNWIERMCWFACTCIASGSPFFGSFHEEYVSDPDIDNDEPYIRVHIDCDVNYYSEKELQDNYVDTNAVIHTSSFISLDHAKAQAADLRYRILNNPSICLKKEEEDEGGI